MIEEILAHPVPVRARAHHEPVELISKHELVRSRAFATGSSRGTAQLALLLHFRFSSGRNRFSSRKLSSRNKMAER